MVGYVWVGVFLQIKKIPEIGIVIKRIKKGVYLCHRLLALLHFYLPPFFRIWVLLVLGPYICQTTFLLVLSCFVLPY